MDFDKLEAEPEIKEFTDVELGVKIKYKIILGRSESFGDATHIGHTNPDSEFIKLHLVSNYNIQYFQLLKKAIQSYEHIPKDYS